MADDDEVNVEVSPAPPAAPDEEEQQQQQPTEEEEQEEQEEEEEEEPSGPPELATLNTSSLSNLAAALGPDGLKLAMLLNVPTTALIRIQCQGVDSGWDQDSIVSSMLFYWKLMRQTAKDRDKVNDLQRALRHIDLNELADAVDQCFQQTTELSGLPTKHPKTSVETEPSADAPVDASAEEAVETPPQ